VVVDRQIAHLVHERGDALSSRFAQQPCEQRRLPASEEAGEDEQGDRGHAVLW